MATIVTKTIGASGRDYSTISAWEAATGIDLVGANQIQVGSIYNDSPFIEDVNVLGATSNSGCYRKLTVAAANHHYGHVDRGAHMSGKMYITENFFYLEKLRMHHEEPYAATTMAICCDSMKSGIINKVLVHDFNTIGDYNDLYGIFVTGCGGMKIFNSVVYHFYKDNNHSNDSSLGGGILCFGNVSGVNNYIINNTVYDFTISGFFSRLDGGIVSRYGNPEFTHCINNISMINGYTDDHSSNPYPETYRYDFEDRFAVDSDYNCSYGGGYGDESNNPRQFAPGAHSLSGIVPKDVFISPSPYDKSGDAFYGYPTKLREPDTNTWNSLWNQSPFYPVQLGETGTITFDYNFYTTMVAGYLYVSAGATGIASGVTSVQTITGPSIYNYTYNNLTHVSGPDMHVINSGHAIQFDPAMITINWSQQLLTPPVAPFVQDPKNNLFISGTIVSGLINMGAMLWDQGGFLTSNVVMTSGVDLRIKATSPVKNAGIYMGGTFSELQTDIQDAARLSTTVADIGAYKSLDVTTTNSYIGNSGTNFHNILVPAILTEAEYIDVSGAGNLYPSIRDWCNDRGGDLVTELRLEVGNVVEDLVGRQQIYWPNNDDKTLITVDIPRTKWDKVSMNDDGKYQVSTSSPYNYIYLSNDYGKTWIPIDPIGSTSGYYISVAINGVGNKLFTTNYTSDNKQKIYISTDYGDTWTAKGISSTVERTKVAMSSDGNVLLTAPDQGPLYLSEDGGETWNDFAPSVIYSSGIGPTPGNFDVYSGIISRKWKTYSISASGDYILATYGGVGQVGVSGYTTSYPYFNSARNADAAGKFCVFNKTSSGWHGREIDPLAASGIYFRTDFRDTAMSHDGEHMIVSSRTNNAVGVSINLETSGNPSSYQTFGALFNSHDYGNTWTQLTVGVSGHHIPIASSWFNATTKAYYIQTSVPHGLTSGDIIRICKHNNPEINDQAFILYPSGGNVIQLFNTYAYTYNAASGNMVGSAIGFIDQMIDWYPVIKSAEGSIVYAAQGTVVSNTPTTSGYMWKSVNYGETWKQRTIYGIHDWQSIATSYYGSIGSVTYDNRIGIIRALTSPIAYYKVLPISTIPRFGIDALAQQGRALDIYHMSYTQVYNVSCSGGRSYENSSGMTGIWSQGGSFVSLINPIIHDFKSAPGNEGTSTGGIHLSGPEGDEDNSFGSRVINPLIYDIEGSGTAHGIISQGKEHEIIGASIYDIRRLHNVDVPPVHYGAGVLITGKQQRITNCISINKPGYAFHTLDYIYTDQGGIIGSGLLGSNNISSDDTAPGLNSYSGKLATEIFMNPGVNFHVKSTSVAKGNGLPVSGYAFDNENVSRLSSWDIGALYFESSSSGFINGLLFGSGVITSVSSYGSGLITPSYLTDIPTMILREETTIDGTYNKGFFSITVQSPIEDKWNFYLEAVHSPSGYILYTASGAMTTPYGFYKEYLELHAGLTDIGSYKIPGSIWAQSVSGTYTTPRIPVHFRRIG